MTLILNWSCACVVRKGWLCMFVPHVCHERFVDKYKPVLPWLLLTEFPNIEIPFLFRLAHEPSPDYSSEKNPDSPYNTNLNPKYANHARYYLSHAFTGTTKTFCTICLDYQCQDSSREKAWNLLVFCKWHNTIQFLFRCKNISSTIWRKIFTEISV